MEERTIYKCEDGTRFDKKEDFSNYDITKLTPNEKDMYDKITEYKK